MADAPATGTEPLAGLLGYIKRTRGFDFTGYKRSSLERRIGKRMEAVGLGTYDGYRDHLEANQDEFGQLFDTILINVTAFFRDEPAWAYLRSEVVPRLTASTPAGAPIRAWCAGCASGEEPYSVAMLLAEALGETAYGERVKIYATDVDEQALAQARSGVYTAKQLETVPPELRERFFGRIEQRYVFRGDLRPSVIFGRNDLVRDAPISHVDLLLCRNTLMYFNAETQGQVLRHFAFALNPGGTLFLGKSEMLLSQDELFEPLELKRRVFAKVGGAGASRRASSAMDEADRRPVPDGDGLATPAFDAAPLALVVLSPDLVVARINHRARTFLNLGPADVGRPFGDLELSYRPVDLSGALAAVLGHRQPVTFDRSTFVTSDGGAREVEITAAPLLIGDRLVGASVAVVDHTSMHALAEELERSRNELNTAYEELQSTVEELETTNEELQSTNEELETSNEELQSTNEELETMNEELQSTNEELETTNEELRDRSHELHRVNTFMETILSGMGVGVIVVDRQQQIRIWNRHAEELWGLREAEVLGEHLLGLDIGLPVEQLKAPVRAVLSGDSEREEVIVDATDRRGRPFRCRLGVVPMPEEGGASAIVLAERAPGAVAARV